MKLTAILMFSAFMQVSAAGFAQSITLNQKNITLKEFFRAIKKQTNYNVSYSNSLIKDTQRIDVNFKSTPLEKALAEVLESRSMSYTFNQKDIIIKVVERSFIDNIIARFQAIDVIGRITNERGEPLVGANIIVKSSGKATNSDNNGYFILKNVKEKSVLVISFVGYLTKEVNAVPELGEIHLEISNSKLDEIQVMAYGRTSQRLSTGNITSNY